MKDFPEPRTLTASYTVDTVHDWDVPKRHPINKFMDRFSFWNKKWMKRIRKRIGLYDTEDEISDIMTDQIRKEIDAEILAAIKGMK